MTTPAPTPQAPGGPQDMAGLLQQLNAAASTPTGGTAKATNLYGLGVWGTQQVNPGDLPFLSSIIGSGQKTTGDQLMKAFLRASADQVATVQHALFMAGYYSTNYTPKWGVISPEDRAAFGQAVTISGQSGAPVAQVLVQGAAYGAQAGLAAAQQQTQGQTGKVAQVNLPNPTDLEALALKAFQDALGHNASPKDEARFAAIYRAMSGGVQRNANQQLYDATNPQAVAGPGNVGQLVQGAVASQPGTGDSTAAGNLNPNVSGAGTPADLAGNMNPNVNQGGTPQQPTAPSFSDQIGNLMSLGQAISTTSAQQPGLTQINTETPMSPDVAAANYARNTHPRQAAANDLANTFQMFLGLLSGVGG